MGDFLEVSGVSKVFENGTVALDGVSIEAGKGEFLVLLGPSGSGKTTLLRSIAGIEHLSGGEISIEGRLLADATRHLPPEQRGLAMVFQDYGLWPHYTACQNVAFALRQERFTKAERQIRACQMLDRVGLAHLVDRYPSELSGGEQQRVALARALVGKRGVVLFDEPLSNLDADLRERMRIEISELVRESGATAIYITHDQAEAFALADSVGVLEKGRLVQTGRPEEIYAEPATAFVARFTGLAAELEIEVGRRTPGGSVVEVALAPGRRGLLARAISPLAKGSASLLLRPSAVRLCPPESEEAHLEGIVCDVAFRGRGYELAVALPDGAKVNGIASCERQERGSTVGLELSPSGCHAVQEETGSSQSTVDLESVLPLASPEPASDPLEVVCW